MKAAVCTDITQPAKSHVKANCYPETTKYFSKATCYGCEHEQITYDAYKKKAISKHLNFSLSKSGLVLDPNYPFLGASPYGTIKCAVGVLESSALIYVKVNLFFLMQVSQNFFLTTYVGYSSWMYIIAAIISKFRLKLKFVLHHTWQEQDLFVQRILYLDEPFITCAFMKANELIKIGILSELVGKWFSTEQNILL